MTVVKTWADLKVGDLIECPGDGRTERVTWTAKHDDGRVFVRTTRHDHYRVATKPVDPPKEET